MLVVGDLACTIRVWTFFAVLTSVHFEFSEVLLRNYSTGGAAVISFVLFWLQSVRDCDLGLLHRGGIFAVLVFSVPTRRA